jgi:hypothetical protein
LEGKDAAPLLSDSGSLNEPTALVLKKLRSKSSVCTGKGGTGRRGSLNRAVQLPLWEGLEGRPCETPGTTAE